MRCGGCEAENRSGIAFCEACGAPLGLTCARCRSALPPGARFCGTCGARAEAAGHEPAPEVERKQVSVLFVDIVHSTALAERLGAERMHAALDGFFRIAGEELGRVGGRVHKQLGDGFMAVFGMPEAIEDHADRAVLAGLAVRDRVERDLALPGGEHLEVRVGIESGTVVVGSLGGAGAADTIGDTANVAARLQALAEPGQVVVGEGAAALLRRPVRLAPLGPVLRGRSAPLAAHLVTGVAPARGALAGLERRPLSPFTGREGALATLTGVIDEAIAGQGQAVAVAGEPGIGKSRLVHELRRRLAGRRLTVLEGRCLPYGQSMPYGPMLDVLRENCGLRPRDPRGRVEEHLGAALDEVGLERDWLPYLVALLADDAGVPAGLTPEAARVRTLEALRRLVLHGGRRRPLLLVVEDLHWIDRTSEELLGLLVDDIDREAIVLLTTHRPGYRLPWLDRPHVTQLALRPLGPADATRLVDAAGGGRLPQDVAAALLERGDGNPLFLEELARAARDGDGGAAVPATVHDVIAARIDRLAPPLRRLLQCAAVLGRDVPAHLLERVWEGDEPVGPRLDELRRAGFLAERPGSPPVHVFKHALVRDVAEASLVERRRQELHARAGRALEELHAGREHEVLDRLAYHHARGGDPAAAVRHLERLAAANAARYAHDEARAALEEALAHAARMPAPEGARAGFRLTVRLVNSLYFLGALDRSERLLADLAPTVDALGDPELEAAFHFWRAHTLSHLGDYTGAEGHAVLALRGARARGDGEGVGRAAYVLSREAWWRGRYAEGIAKGRRAVAELARAGATWWLVHCRCYVGHSLLHTGELAAAREEARSALAAAEEAGDPRLRSFAGWSLGMYLATGGDADAGVAECERAVRLSPDPANTAWAHGILGFATGRAGRHREAVALLEGCLGDIRRSRHLRVSAWFGAWLAEAQLGAGEPGRARTAAERALREAEAVRVPWAATMALRALGEAAMAEGRPRDARAALLEARRRQLALGTPLEAARTAAALARLGESGGRPLRGMTTRAGPV